MPLLHQIIQRAQNFFDRRQRVESVQVINVDVIGAEPPQAGFASLNQMVARRSHIVRPLAHAEGRLGGDQDLVATSVDGLAEDRFRQAVRIDIGGIEQIDARVEADIDEPRRLRDVAGAPRLEKLGSAAKRSRAETQHRNFQSRLAKLSKFHRCV